MNSFRRFRRLRQNDRIRSLIRETQLSKHDLILPLFIRPGTNVRKEITSMPGVYQLSIDNIVKECITLQNIGINAVLLFGIPERKDEVASEAYREDGIVQQSIAAIKKDVPDLVVITDVCLCEYTTHGHCGILKEGRILNDESVEVIGRIALSHVQAGADIVAPSDMFDGRVKAIREIFDRNGYSEAPIISYAVKYASAFYGPFRDAAENTPRYGDRKSHQMDPANSDEALKEAEQDLVEGADIIMIKPALPYLDIINRVKSQHKVPVAAYNVSGEYAMIKAASINNWIDGEKVMMETLLSIKRAGADLIVTYFAKEAAGMMET